MAGASLAAIASADLVLVLWTEHSIKSRFVIDEAEVAFEQGKLVSVLLGTDKLPLGLGSIHAVDLRAVDVTEVDQDLAPLLSEIDRRVIKKDACDRAGGRAAGGPQRSSIVRRISSAAAMLGLSTAVAIGVLQTLCRLLLPHDPEAADVAYGLVQALYAAVASSPATAFAAIRSARLGVARLRAVARPFVRTLLISLIAALVFGGLAVIGGADSDKTPAVRLYGFVSTTLQATMLCLALLGSVRLARVLAGKGVN